MTNCGYSTESCEATPPRAHLCRWGTCPGLQTTAPWRCGHPRRACRFDWVCESQWHAPSPWASLQAWCRLSSTSFLGQMLTRYPSPHLLCLSVWPCWGVWFLRASGQPDLGSRWSPLAVSQRRRSAWQISSSWIACLAFVSWNGPPGVMVHPSI